MEESGLSYRIMNKIKHPIIILIFRLILGFVMIYASFDKISNPKDFADIVQNYHAIPYSLTNLVAIFLPWLELCVGACLILGIFVDGASLINLVLMGMFIILLSQALIRGIDVECGCFTVSEEGSKIALRRVMEDILFLGMTYLVFTRKERKYELFPK